MPLSLNFSPRKLFCCISDSSVASSNANEPPSASYRGRSFQLFQSKAVIRPQKETVNKCFDPSAREWMPIENPKVKKAMDNELGKVATQLNRASVKDPEYIKQTVEASLAAVYSRAKDQCCQRLVDLGHTIIPLSYQREIGEAAQNVGLPCIEKNGIFTPNGAGANPLLNNILGSARTKFPSNFKAESERESNTTYVHSKLLEVVEPYAQKSKRVSLIGFAQKLEEIANKHEKPPVARIFRETHL
ncbi:hypothetical protein [Iodobacter fluviatilis]|uniref:Guanine nucleotide exchange factor SopE GEF domain-containing protein n=1 Tax=Iodobacter fluviatilis TaxID=537 RepID=A0A7G3GAD2_9NEIS|nr:hypothetical protein [Iodobacter fluviatilis]QBC44128.1 hypothetical protein C1H71_11710 [Iodobacter fluviatilis]